MTFLFDLAMPLLRALPALFSWINRCFLRLPHSIGLLPMALFTLLAHVGIDALARDQDAFRSLT